MVFGVRQGGKSLDIVIVLAETRRHGALTAVITNEPDSELAGEADHVISFHAGIERVAAAIKKKSKRVNDHCFAQRYSHGEAQMQAELIRMPDILPRTLRMNEAIF